MSKFIIPKQIESLYKIEGELANSRNWKAKIVEANSAGKGIKKGMWDTVRYVMISLDSNNIIPIAISDEHHVGYDVLGTFYSKYKVPREDYVSVCSWGNHYIYQNDKEEQLKALKKYLELGGNPNLAVQYADDYSNKTHVGTAYGFVNSKGMLEIVPGKIAPLGKKLITLWESIIVGLVKERDERIFADCWKLIELIEGNVYYFFSLIDGQVSEVMNDLKTKISGYEKAKDYDGLENYLLSFNGLKNQMHNNLRKKMDSGERDLIKLFGDVKLAKIEFDRLGTISKGSIKK